MIDLYITLDNLAPGECAEIVALNLKPTAIKRLADFGCISGTKVTCLYRNPWKDVTAIEFRGTVVAVRTCSLRKIMGIYL